MKQNYSGPFLTIGIIALIIMIAGGVWYVRAPEKQAAPPTAAAHPQAQATPAPQPGPTLPSFDAFRVGSDGKAVIAGHAEPDAKVTVLDHGVPVANATADKNGEWVAMTDLPLSPGAQALSLSAQSPGTVGPRKSATTLAVIVPENATQPPLAVALPQEGAAKPFGASAAPVSHRVALDMVEYDASGKTILSGRADSGAAVNVFIDERSIGAVSAGADGSWSLALDAGVPVGQYRLRLVSRERDGTQQETALDMRRVSPAEMGGADYLAVVPGNTLWHLARRSYGDGLRYVEIYRANRSEIADPNLIYPNQLLALPGKS
jgi:nucleoid-associated protein YgaU